MFHEGDVVRVKENVMELCIAAWGDDRNWYHELMIKYAGVEATVEGMHDSENVYLKHKGDRYSYFFHVSAIEEYKPDPNKPQYYRRNF